MTKKKKAEAGVAVVKYDRAMLKETEVQPVAEMDGHTICVNTFGKFTAKVGEVDVRADTLDQAKEKVHRAHMAQARKKAKKATAVRAVLHVNVAPEGSRFNTKPKLVEGFFTGIHAGQGDFLWRLPNGETGRSDDRACFVFHPDDPVLPRLREIMARIEALEAEQSKLEIEKEEILERQSQRQLKGVGEEEEVWRRGRRGGRYVKRLKIGRIDNDAEKAYAYAEAIVNNILKAPPEG